MILPYFLGFVLFGAIVLREFRTFRAALILFGDWAACTFLATVAGSQTEWIGLAVIDGLAALLLLRCRRRMEAVLALSLVAEVVLHLSFGWHEVIHITAYAADYYHWWATFYVAWGQAIGLVAWGITHGGKRYTAPDRVLSPVRDGISSPQAGGRNPVSAVRGRND
jgi:hypothetical protein